LALQPNQKKLVQGLDELIRFQRTQYTEGMSAGRIQRPLRRDLDVGRDSDRLVALPADWTEGLSYGYLGRGPDLWNIEEIHEVRTARCPFSDHRAPSKLLESKGERFTGRK